MWCRSGLIRTFVRRGGIDSVIPKSCQNMVDPHFLRCGGGTKTRQRRCRKDRDCMKLSRRNALSVIAGAAAAGAGARFAAPASAQDADRHGMSAFGDLKYPADFANFTYVNVKAPKGGAYSEIVSSRGYNGSLLTFTSLNGYILKGEGAFGMDFTFATLMLCSGDEPDAMYGLAARSVQITDNGLTYRFTLRPETKFHDGTPLTAHDVAWSINTLKEKGHPIITQQLRDCKGAEAAEDRKS